MCFFGVKVDRKKACGGPPMEECFLDEGSPTMVEKGMDPASVFEIDDDDDDNDNDNGIHDVKDAGGGGAGAAEGVNAAAAPQAFAFESSASVRHRRRGRSVERIEPKTKRESWMEPPEERESTTLTQAEIESCMQTFEVRGSKIPKDCISLLYKTNKLLIYQHYYKRIKSVYHRLDKTKAFMKDLHLPHAHWSGFIHDIRKQHNP